MRGLLIKDFKLIKSQKNFFFLIVLVAIGMSTFTEEASFIIGYMTFIGSLFTLSSISYDEFDNGNAFMFSLPITRKDYTLEKYSFGIIIGGASWLLATLIAFSIELIKNTNLTMETIMGALMILPIMLVMLAVMLPFQLKFGGEKARVAMIVVVGLIFITGFIIVKIASALNIDLISIINNLPSVSMGMVIVIAIAITIIILFLSYKISLSIMNKKEF